MRAITVFIYALTIGLCNLTLSDEVVKNEINDLKPVNPGSHTKKTSTVDSEYTTEHDRKWFEAKKNKGMIIPDLKMRFVYVAPGSFQMGANDEYNDEKPVHEVTISRGYWIGKYEVTQRDYQSIMASNPSQFMGYNKPVERVTWYAAVKFCQKLTARERSAGRLPSGYEYRLPTEAEWEFAARGGTKSRRSKYSGGSVDRVALYRSNSGRKTHAVGTKSGNELGIYDMSGNVWEWCYDWKDRYSGKAQIDPTGTSKGSDRVLRGGSWSSRDTSCSVANRGNKSPGLTFNHYGFRVAIAPVIQSSKSTVNTHE